MASLTIEQIACINPSTGVADWFEDGIGIVCGAFGTGVGTVLGAAAGIAVGETASNAAAAVTGPAAIVIAPIADLASFVGGATVGGAIGSSVGGAISAGVVAASDAAIQAIGQNLPDQVYMEADGDSVWPSGSGLTTPTVSMKSGDTENPGVVVPIPDGGSVTLKLKEWDVISDDDLGNAVFTANSVSSVYSFQNSDEGDVYYVTITVNP